MAIKISDDFMCLKINGKIRASLHAGRLAARPAWRSRCPGTGPAVSAPPQVIESAWVIPPPSIDAPAPGAFIARP